MKVVWKGREKGVKWAWKGYEKAILRVWKGHEQGLKRVWRGYENSYFVMVFAWFETGEYGMKYMLT